jgi:hypothetical protein
MIRYLLHKFVSRFERRYHYDATYLHELADISPGAFRRFASVQLKLQSKTDAPRDRNRRRAGRGLRPLRADRIRPGRRSGHER